MKQALWEIGIDIDNGPNGDPWGSSMGAHFSAAHALEHADEDIPHEWGYRDSIACHGFDTDEDYEAIAITAAVQDGRLTWEDVRRIGDVLHRYERLLERAGRSY